MMGDAVGEPQSPLLSPAAPVLPSPPLGYFVTDPCEFILGTDRQEVRGVSLGVVTMRVVRARARASNALTGPHVIATCAVSLGWSVPAPVIASPRTAPTAYFASGRGAYRISVRAQPRFWQAVDARTNLTGESTSAAIRALFDAGRALIDHGCVGDRVIPRLSGRWRRERFGRDVAADALRRRRNHARAKARKRAAVGDRDPVATGSRAADNAARSIHVDAASPSGHGDGS